MEENSSGNFCIVITKYITKLHITKPIIRINASLLKMPLGRSGKIYFIKAYQCVECKGPNHLQLLVYNNLR